MVHVIMNYLNDNKEWFFSGIGVLILTSVYGNIKKCSSRTKKNNTKTMKQVNKNASSGVQIGVQNNYNTKEKSDE